MSWKINPLRPRSWLDTAAWYMSWCLHPTKVESPSSSSETTSVVGEGAGICQYHGGFQMIWPMILESLTNPNVMLMHAVAREIGFFQYLTSCSCLFCWQNLQARALRPWIIVAGHRSEKRFVFSWHTLLAYGQALETQTSLLYSHHSPINVFYNQLATFHLISSI